MENIAMLIDTGIGFSRKVREYFTSINIYE
jgi:hypothetical protein